MIRPHPPSVFNNYVRSELGYKSDTRYTIFAFQDEAAFRKWDWGSAIDGFPDTASALRQAITKNKYLKVLVMQGDYDLATPFFAAEYSMNHLNLSPEYRKNISFATYGAGHMVYVDTESLAKFKHDLVSFIDQALPGGQ